jgi:chromate transporter
MGSAETTPGPLVMVLQFVGFMAAFRSPGLFPPLLAGALGGLLASWVTFTPCFLWIFAGAPYIEQLRGNKSLTGALSAITAAVVGVMLNLGIWFAVRTVFPATRHIVGFGLSVDAPVPTTLDVWSFILALGAAIAIFRFKVGMIATLVGSCAASTALHAFGLVA